MYLFLKSFCLYSSAANTSTLNVMWQKWLILVGAAQCSAIELKNKQTAPCTGLTVPGMEFCRVLSFILTRSGQRTTSNSPMKHLVNPTSIEADVYELNTLAFGVWTVDSIIMPPGQILMHGCCPTAVRLIQRIQLLKKQHGAPTLTPTCLLGRNFARNLCSAVSLIALFFV